MSQSKIAARYARALFANLSQSSQISEQWGTFSSLIKELFSVDDARKILQSPVMPSDLKKKLVEYAISGANNEIQGDLTRFNTTLVEAGRVELWPDIVNAVQEMIDQNQGVQRVELKVSADFDSGTTKNIGEQLERLLKKKVDLHQSTDPSLLGGFVVRIGNQVIDLSLKKRLDDISRLAVS